MPTDPLIEAQANLREARESLRRIRERVLNNLHPHADGLCRCIYCGAKYILPICIGCDLADEEE